MRTLLDLGLTNAVLATVLAIIAAVVGRLCRRPALTHSLWLLVFLKLLTPAFVPVPLPHLHWAEPAAADAEATPTALRASEAAAPTDLSASLDRLEADIAVLRSATRPSAVPTEEGPGQVALSIEGDFSESD